MTLFYIIILFTLTTCTPVQVLVKPAAIFEAGQKPKNIVLMIGDGMGLSLITATMYNSKTPLNLERFPIIGFQKTHSASDLVTDSAAGATAIACGVKTFNGGIGVTPDSIPCTTILEHAEANGLSTGLVVSSTVVHATPAAFISHQASRAYYEAIAKDFLKTEIDFFVGGGKKYFDRRAMDDRNLYKELENKGYQVSDYFQKDLKSISLNFRENFAYFTADGDPLPYNLGRKYMPYATKLGVNFLDKHDDKGFFLMVEGSQIDWAAHANKINWMMQEVMDFDKAVGYVLDFAIQDKGTLVIVTADHETGGMAINKGSKRRKLKTAFTGTRARAHTAVMVPVFAYGPGAEKFSGIYNNTEIFSKMIEALGFETEAYEEATEATKSDR